MPGTIIKMNKDSESQRFQAMLQIQNNIVSMKQGQDSKVPEPESVTMMLRIFTKNHGEMFVSLPSIFLTDS